MKGVKRGCVATTVFQVAKSRTEHFQAKTKASY